MLHAIQAMLQNLVGSLLKRVQANITAKGAKSGKECLTST